MYLNQTKEQIKSLTVAEAKKQGWTVGVTDEVIRAVIKDCYRMMLTEDQAKAEGVGAIGDPPKDFYVYTADHTGGDHQWIMGWYYLPSEKIRVRVRKVNELPVRYNYRNS